jgi:hypothetical protein
MLPAGPVVQRSMETAIGTRYRALQLCVAQPSCAGLAVNPRHIGGLYRRVELY